MSMAVLTTEQVRAAAGCLALFTSFGVDLQARVFTRRQDLLLARNTLRLN